VQGERKEEAAVHRHDRHDAQDAADASVLLATVTQLGQLIGVAAFGTVFLNRLESLGARGRIPLRKRFSHACSRSQRRPPWGPCPDWY
jgi:hypothetical protein